MYGVQSSKSFLVGRRHVEIIGSSKERNKISNNISDKRYKQRQIWLVRRQDFHSFLHLWYGRHLRPGGTVSQILLTYLCFFFPLVIFFWRKENRKLERVGKFAIHFPKNAKKKNIVSTLTQFVMLCLLNRYFFMCVGFSNLLVISFSPRVNNVVV